jgi:hypothetical protein
MSAGGKVRRGKCPRGKSPQGKCPFTVRVVSWHILYERIDQDNNQRNADARFYRLMEVPAGMRSALDSLIEAIRPDISLIGMSVVQ